VRSTEAKYCEPIYFHPKEGSAIYKSKTSTGFPNNIMDIEVFTYKLSDMLGEIKKIISLTPFE